MKCLGDVYRIQAGRAGIGQALSLADVCRVVDKRLTTWQKKSFPFPLVMCTLLMHRAHFALLFLRWSDSLRSLCVALSRAKGDTHEITTCICNCFGSRTGSRRAGIRVDASSNARSRTEWADWTTPGMSSDLWQDPTSFRQTRTDVSPVALPPQGASTWGRLAH